jgi:carboxyl-terminal processing protease
VTRRAGRHHHRARVGTLAAAVVLGAAAASAQAPRGLETFDAAWTIVRDSHFDATLNGVDWDAVRAELRPRAVGARTTRELRGVINSMLGRLGQSHFALIPGSADVGAAARDLSGDPGFDVRLLSGESGLIVSRVDPEGAAAKAGIKPGWILLEIDGAPVNALLRALPDGTGRGPEAHERLRRVEAWRLAETRLRGPSGSILTVAFEDIDGRSVRTGIQRRPEAGEPVTVGNLPTMFVRVDAEARTTPAGATAGIIRFNVWMAAVDAPFQRAIDAFRNADGIVVDLRGNPGGLAAMMMGLSGHFLDEPKPLGVMKTRDHELRFAANPRRVNAAGERVTPFAGPLAILVDALTGSASECFAGGLQSLGRARVFGQVSMGQALPALFDRLPNGDVLIHAYGDFVTADGTRLEGRGVIPDEIVPLRREALASGRDEPLEAALAWIDRERAQLASR